MTLLILIRDILTFLFVYPNIQWNLQPTPSPAQPCAGRTLKVDVTTDTYPGETSWTLTNTCTGETTESVDQNTMYTAQSTPYSKEYCVAEAAYEFTINDSYGDGNCCDYGSGSYSVTYGDDEVAFGGQFASSESTTFGRGSCDGQPTDSPTPLVRHAIFILEHFSK